MTDASVRVVPADVLTPIGAYNALAQPQASCLLESVESGGRISRYSFIGLDYIAAENFAAGDRLYERVREFISAHRTDGDNAQPRRAHCWPFPTTPRAATRDFRHALHRSRRCRPPIAPIPATWLIFDHFTDSLTIWCSGGESTARERRIDGYVERLLAAKPALAADRCARAAR